MKPKEETLFNSFRERLGRYTHHELVEVFNRETQIATWGTARASFLAALHQEFLRRGFDISEVGDESSMCIKDRIFIREAGEGKIRIERTGSDDFSAEETIQHRMN